MGMGSERMGEDLLGEEGRERAERAKAAAREEPTAGSVERLEGAVRDSLEGGRDEEALRAGGGLLEEGGLEAAGRPGQAPRRVGELAGGGQRLCAALVVGPLGEDPGVPEAAREKASRAGFAMHGRLFGAGALGEMLFSARRRLALGLARGSSEAEGREGVAPSEIVGGSRAGMILALLPGAGRGSWDGTGARERRLALESLREIGEAAAPGCAAIAAGELDEIVSRRNRLAGPLLLASLGAKAASQALASPKDLAASASLHGEDPQEPEFWRIALRARRTGFLLDGMDIPLEGDDAQEVFRDIAMALAALGLERIYRIEGVGGEERCPVCAKAVYPTPDDPAWKAALIEAGMPVDGRHPHPELGGGAPRR